MYQLLNLWQYGAAPENTFRHITVDENGLIVPDAWDGSFSVPIHANYFCLYHKKKGEERFHDPMMFNDIDMEVVFTDSRVLFRCDKYDKGNVKNPIGGIAVAIWAIDKAVAAKRSSGKTLAGHLRYEWLWEVHYQKKHGFLSNELLRFFYEDDEKTQWMLDLHLKKHEDARAVARTIYEKALRYRLAMTDDKKPDYLQSLQERLQNPTPENPDPKCVTNLRMGVHYYAPKGEEYRPALG